MQSLKESVLHFQWISQSSWEIIELSWVIWVGKRLVNNFDDIVHHIATQICQGSGRPQPDQNFLRAGEISIHQWYLALLITGSHLRDTQLIRPVEVVGPVFL
jgi:hypothetical protein